MASSTNGEIAARWAAGLAGEWSLLEQLTSSTLRGWHSHDDQWMERAQAEGQMAQASAAGLALEDVRTLITEQGFVVQAVLDAGAGSGRTHIIQICTVEDGLVASCEEYVAPQMNLA